MLLEHGHELLLKRQLAMMLWLVPLRNENLGLVSIVHPGQAYGPSG